MLKVKRLESQVIYYSLGASKSKGLNRIAKIGNVTFWSREENSATNRGGRWSRFDCSSHKISVTL